MPNTPKLPPRQLADDIKAAIAELASGTNYPDLIAAIDELAEAATSPIDMVLHCPKCGMQHIDAQETINAGPDERGRPTPSAVTWDNPPHRSHKCHGCGYIWRPADVETNGVAAVKTTGKADSPIAAPATAPNEPRTDDFGEPIVYDTDAVDEVAHALTGDEGEDDSVTVLQSLARYVANVWPGKTAMQVLMEYEERSMPATAGTVVPAEAMDWPLPCDVTVGHVTMRKGVPLRTLVQRMKLLHEMATSRTADKDVVVFDGPDAFADVDGARQRFDAEVEAAGGLEAWKAAAAPAPRQDDTEGAC